MEYISCLLAEGLESQELTYPHEYACYKGLYNFEILFLVSHYKLLAKMLYSLIIIFKNNHSYFNFYLSFQILLIYVHLFNSIYYRYFSRIIKSMALK